MNVCINICKQNGPMKPSILRFPYLTWIQTWKCVFFRMVYRVCAVCCIVLIYGLYLYALHPNWLDISCHLHVMRIHFPQIIIDYYRLLLNTTIRCFVSFNAFSIRISFVQSMLFIALCVPKKRNNISCLRS